MSTETTPRPHAEFSPSSLKYRAHCHFWKQDLSSPWGTRFSEEGELLHRSVPPGMDLTPLDPEQRKMVEEVRECLTEYLHFPHEWEPKVTVLDQWGYADLICFPTPEEAVIFDFKFGLWEVEDARENYQLQAYALGVLLQHATLKKVTVIILQPRTGSASSGTFSRSDTGWLQARVDTIIANAKKPTTYRRGDGCNFCGARAGCPALLGLARDIAIVYDEELQVLSNLDWHSSELNDPRAAFVALELARVMTAWADSVRVHITAKTVSGELTPEGYVLASRKAAAKPIQGSIAMSALLDATRSTIDPGEFLEHVQITVPDLIALARSKASRGQKGAIEDMLMSQLNKLGLVERAEDIQYMRRIKNFQLPALSAGSSVEVTTVNT